MSPSPSRILRTPLPGAIFLAVGLVWALWTPSQADAVVSHRSAIGLDRIDQAWREGRLTYAQALNYKVDALFHPKDLPAEYRPTGPLKSGTAVIREALTHRDRLTAKNRLFLRRPTDGTVSDEFHYGNVAVASYASLGGHFRLHYTTEDNNPADTLPGDAVPVQDVQNGDGTSAPSGDGVPDYVEAYARFLEESWTHEVGTLGFSALPDDGTLGGDSRVDVYLKNINAYGLTLYDQTPDDVYMIVENDYAAAEGFPGNFDPAGRQEGDMKVTAAHEFFHVLQWQISTNCDGNCWWMEASSTWMEDEVYPQVKDYLNYLDSWFAAPQLPLDTYNGRFEYGTSVWAKFLSEKYGAGIIREIWTTISDVPLIPALEAIRRVLTTRGSSLEAELREFRGKNGALIYWDTPYGDGAYYVGSVNAVYGNETTENYAVSFRGSCSAASGDCYLDPLSAYYYLFSAEMLTQGGGLTVSYQAKSGSSAVLVLPMTNAFAVPISASDIDPTPEEVTLNAGGAGSLTVTPFGPTAQYKQVMVVVLNTGETASSGTLAVCFSAVGSPACSGGSSGGRDNRCFIATAAYGSPLHPYVQLLREFRDRYLLTHPAGRTFVEFYYRHSPPIARRIAEDPVLKGATEAALVPAVAFAAFMVKTTLLEKGVFFLVVWWGLRRRRRNESGDLF